MADILSQTTQSQPAEMPIKVTDAALEQMKRLLARKNPDAYIRIGVKAGGCSGMEYVLKMEDAPRDTDTLYELSGVRILIDPKSPRFLQGTTLEYTGNLLSGGFAFENPNAKRSCGCGTSFSV